MMRQFSKIYISAIVVLLIFGIVACNFFEQKHNTSPVASADPEYAANFSVRPSTGSKFGVALGPGAFLVQVLQGDYLLSYTTQLGTFYIPFRALEVAKLTIGLQPNDTVIDVTLQPGTITDISQGTGLEDNTVIALPWPGSGSTVNWENVFSVDFNIPMIVLVQGGQVVESEQVEDLGGEQTLYFGIYVGNGSFQVYVPRGDFMIEYTTTYGTFQVVFRATRQTFVTIPLMGGDKLLDVNIQQGMIPIGVEPIEDQGDIKVYLWPGASSTLVWSNVFIVNAYMTPVILVQGGVVVTNNTYVIILPGYNQLPWGFDPGTGGEFSGDDDDDDDDDGGSYHHGGIIIIIIIIG